MGRKGVKISSETKLKYAKLCFEGKMGVMEAKRELGIGGNDISQWIRIYREQGELGFLDTGRNHVYSDEIRQKAVLSYLNGEGSLSDIVAKYGLRSHKTLRKWIKMYNNGESFKRKTSGGSRMHTSRKTTKEERVQIVRDCIRNGCNYGESALKHNVSYQQVYSWVKRYTELGEAGLEDRRGKRKVSQDPRSEVEKLQIELEQLKHKLYMTEMERDLLKKVGELERKDRYRK